MKKYINKSNGYLGITDEDGTRQDVAPNQEFTLNRKVSVMEIAQGIVEIKQIKTKKNKMESD